jgi:hypothetical protein
MRVETISVTAMPIEDWLDKQGLTKATARLKMLRQYEYLKSLGVTHNQIIYTLEAVVSIIRNEYGE